MRLRETNMNFVRISDSEFNLDTISWVTPRLAVTDVNGALDMHEESDCYIINVAREIDSPCDFKLPVAPFIHGPEEVRAALDTLADVIQDQLEGTDNRVVVHCFAGMERSVLTCVWYLCKHQGMSMDEAYETVREVRPVALDRREWVGG
jgi:protein-tyrosine phosphatase